MTLVKIWSFLGALDNSQQPVIIGAPPPPDSGHARAQQIYADGTINYSGPHRLPCLIGMHIDTHLLADTAGSDPFLVSTVAEDPITNGVPGKFKPPTDHQVPLSTADPSSPSPKCCEPCRPLTESMQQEKDVHMSEKPSIAPAPPLAVGPPPLLPPRPTIGSQEATLNNGFVGGPHGPGEWMDPSCQVGGGYVFHPPGQYLPYHDGDHGLMPPP